VAGGFLFCLALFLVFRWGRRSGKKTRDSPAAADGQTPPDGGAAAPPVATKPELDGAESGMAAPLGSPGDAQAASVAATSGVSPLTSSSPPPMYPGWQDQPQQHYGPPSPPQELHGVPGSAAYPRPRAQEMHATSWRPEMGDPSQMRHEMPTQGYGGGVYEMPSGAPP